MELSPSMIERLEVFEKVDEEYSGFLWCHKGITGIHLLYLKDSPENIQLTYYATIKFYKLVEV